MIISVLLSIALVLSGLGRHAQAQEGALEPVDVCAQTCAKLVCSYFGQEYDLRAASKYLAPGEFGEVSINKLADFFNSETIGLSCRVVRINLDRLSSIQGHPKVLHVSFRPITSEPITENPKPIGHFAVATFGEDGRIVFFDPSASPTPYELGPDKLRKYWSGVAIVFDPLRDPFNDLVAMGVGGGVSLLLGVGTAVRRGHS